MTCEILKKVMDTLLMPGTIFFDINNYCRKLSGLYSFNVHGFLKEETFFLRGYNFDKRIRKL